MKEILLQIRIVDGKMAIASSYKGYNPSSMSDQLEIYGILNHLASVQDENIKTNLKIKNGK